MNKKRLISIIIVIGVVIFAVIVGYFIGTQQTFFQEPAREVSSFGECVKAGYPVGESYPRQCWTPDGRNFVEEIEQNPPLASGPITTSGEITCLPKKGGAGGQTAECAIGLRDLDGRHYGLKNLFQHDPEYKFSVDGLRVEVSGTFSSEVMKGPDGNKYDVVGVIDVASIKEVKQVSGGGCVIDGCNSEICAGAEEERMSSICLYRPEYACYKDTKCERQGNGQCGWTATEELRICLANKTEER